MRQLTLRDIRNKANRGLASSRLASSSLCVALVCVLAAASIPGARAQKTTPPRSARREETKSGRRETAGKPVVNRASGARQVEARRIKSRGVDARRRVEPAHAAAGLVKQAMEQACAEREQDPSGSAPIDEMQARPSLPLRHAEVVAGAARAERLLPVAKTLAADALRQLARAHAVPDAVLRPALARVAQVRAIKPDMELRDNASVIYKEPRTIRFGTLFLAGLRSDEGMISVLAHELTHVADGATGSLSALFRSIAQQAARAAQLRIKGRRGEELTCDLVGALAARAYIARTPGVETLARRTSRALEHNCVEQDQTDNVHLSPRSTMRALLTLDPSLAREITGEKGAATIAAPVATAPPAPRGIRHAAHPIAPRRTATTSPPYR